MCLIFIAHRPRAGLKLVIAANRDEHFSRPTAAAHFWADAPGVFAGRDLDKGGTWLGITRSGRFAAITNFRGAPPVADGRSRGAVAAAFLRSNATPPDFIAALSGDAGHYQGFSVIAGDGDSLWYYSNQDTAHARGCEIEPGVHGLSNHLLDTPWPKIERGRARFTAALPAPADVREQAHLALLCDRAPPPDAALVTAGAPIAFERALAAPFIHAPERDYGTRCSTLLAIDDAGAVSVVEHTWDRAGSPLTQVREAFTLE